MFHSLIRCHCNGITLSKKNQNLSTTYLPYINIMLATGSEKPTNHYIRVLISDRSIK